MNIEEKKRYICVLNIKTKYAKKTELYSKID